MGSREKVEGGRYEHRIDLDVQRGYAKTRGLETYLDKLGRLKKKP
jgi:hypothetical protein